MVRNKVSTSILSMFLATSMMVPSYMVPSAAAAETAMNGHWAAKEMNNWKDLDFIRGYEDGSLHPDATITRAEFAALINRLFAFDNKATLSFSDVSPTDWYYEDIAKAKSAGYLSGYEDGTVKPNQPISRQEVAAILNSIVKPSSSDSTNQTNSFKDDTDIPNWSRQAIKAVAASGYMNGYPDQTFQPSKSITRSEAVVTLDRSKQISSQLVRYGSAGAYSSNATGNVIIGAPDVKLNDMVIEGNLIVTESVGEGNVLLHNVTIKGKTVIKGGGPNSVVLEDSTLGQVEVRKEHGDVRLLATGKTTVQGTQMQSGGKLEDKSASGNAFGQVTVAKNTPSKSLVTLAGAFDRIAVHAADVTVQMDSGKYSRLTTEVDGKPTSIIIKDGTVQELNIGPNTKLDIRGGTIGNLTVAKGASLNSIVIANTAIITNLILNSPVSINGSGTIVNVTVNANGSQFEKQPQNIILGQGVTTHVGGVEIKTSTSLPGSGSSGSSGGGSSYRPDITPPAIPTGLKAEAGNGKVSLSWNANMEFDVAGYIVYNGNTKLSTVTSTTYTVVGLQNGTSYTFSVSAVDTSGNESAKTQVQATPIAQGGQPDIEPPAAPVGLAAAAGNSSVTLTWSANTEKDLQGYNIYLNSIKMNPQTVTTTTYTLSGLTNGTTYTFSVSAVDTSGNESIKTQVQATPIAQGGQPDIEPPAAPVGLAAAAGNSSVTLTWSANTEKDLQGYNIYLNSIKMNPQTVTTTTYTLSGLTNGTTYTFSVSAVDTSGNESTKTQVQATPSVTIAEVRLMPDNTLGVKAIGTVTTIPVSGNNSFYMQDATGGIYIFNPTMTETIALGDQVEVTGKKVTFSGEVELDKGASVRKLGTGKVPSPIETALDKDALLARQGQLVVIKGVTVSDLSVDNKFRMNKDGQSFEVFLGKYGLKSGTLANGSVIDVIGIASIYLGNPQIYPRTEQDFGISDDLLVAKDKQALTLGDTSAVRMDLSLPTEGDNGTTITWSSNNPAIVDNNGKVTRPAKGSSDVAVILTATVQKGTFSDTKSFTITVIANAMTDAEAVAAMKASLTVSYDGIQPIINLPISGTEGTTLAWSLQDSSQANIVDVQDGFVTNQGLIVDTTVNLIATITRGGASDSKVIPVLVKKDNTPPAVTILSQGVVIVGNSVQAKSSEIGILYLVPNSSIPTNKTDLDQYVSAGTAQKAAVTTPNISVNIATDHLNDGKYNVYAVDAAGNIGTAQTQITLLSAANMLSVPTINPIDDSSLTLTGQAEAGATVTVKVGPTQLGSTTANGAGLYSIAIAKQGAGKTLEVTASNGISTSNSVFVLVFATSTPAAPALTADTIHNKVGSDVEITFTDSTAWRSKITTVKAAGKVLASNQYSFTAGKLTIKASTFTAAGNYSIVVQATGYRYATLLQNIAPNVTLTPLTTPTNFQVAGTSITWDAVPHAAGYTVTILNGSATVKTLDTTVPTINLAAQSLATGSYTVKVKAKGDQTAYSDSNDSSASGAVNIVNSVPPVFVGMYPKAGTIGLTTAELKVMANEDGKVYYAVVASGASAPTTAAVKNQSVSAAIQGQSTLTANTEATIAITGLNNSTSYDIYVAIEDNSNDLQPILGKVSITTAAPDVTAPTFTITGSSVTSSTYSFNVKSNEIGNAYYVVVLSNETAPTAVQIKAGTNSSGTAPIQSKQVTLTAANTDVPVTISGLTAGTSYSVYVVAEDAAHNLAAPQKLDANPVAVPQDPVSIIPIRTDVAGFSTWSDTDITGTSYLTMIKATSATITPAMDFTQYQSMKLDFKARTYGGGTDTTKFVVVVSISQDNGATWVNVTTKTPADNTLKAQPTIDLSSYSGTKVKIKFTTPGANGSIGAGIDDITITGVPK